MAFIHPPLRPSRREATKSRNQTKSRAPSERTTTSGTDKRGRADDCRAARERRSGRRHPNCPTRSAPSRSGDFPGDGSQLRRQTATCDGMHEMLASARFKKARMVSSETNHAAHQDQGRSPLKSQSLWLETDLLWTRPKEGSKLQLYSRAQKSMLNSRNFAPKG